MNKGKGGHPQLRMARQPKGNKSRNHPNAANFFSIVLVFVLVTASIGFLYKYLISQTGDLPFPPLLSTAITTPKIISGQTLQAGQGSNLDASRTKQVSTEVTQTTPMPAITEAVRNPDTPVDMTYQASENQFTYDQFGDTSAINSGLFSADRGCKWLGVGGQVLDLQGRPAIGVSVEIGGELEGAPVDLSSLAGTALQYGKAGFEFTLADHPLSSSNTLWIQLIDKSQKPISRKIFFSTDNDCSKSVVIINFKQVK